MAPAEGSERLGLDEPAAVVCAVGAVDHTAAAGPPAVGDGGHHCWVREQGEAAAGTEGAVCSAWLPVETAARGFTRTPEDDAYHLHRNSRSSL